MKKSPPIPTPKKIKRFAFKRPVNQVPSGHYVGSMQDPEFGARVARVLSEFVRLEGKMGIVLAVLLGLEDDQSAGYILRSIKSPRGRLDVMRDLLELAPQNKNKSRVYDDLLADFWSINQRRNAYVHGLWWTNLDTKETYLAEENEHGFGFEKARVATLRELDDLLERMGKLLNLIVRVALADMGAERKLREQREELNRRYEQTKT